MRTGPGSVVGTAIGYRPEGPGIESRWGASFSAPVQTGPGPHPVSYTMGTGSFPRAKNGRGVMLTPHPLLVPWSRKGRAIPLLPLWAVRPAQNFSAYRRVHFFTMCTVPSFLFNGILISSAYILAVLISYLFPFSRTPQILLAAEIFPENITQQVKNSRPLKCSLVRSVTVMRM